MQCRVVAAGQGRQKRQPSRTRPACPDFDIPEVIFSLPPTPGMAFLVSWRHDFRVVTATDLRLVPQRLHTFRGLA